MPNVNVEPGDPETTSTGALNLDYNGHYNPNNAVSI